jgi:hypothetical protein
MIAVIEELSDPSVAIWGDSLINWIVPTEAVSVVSPGSAVPPPPTPDSELDPLSPPHAASTRVSSTAVTRANSFPDIIFSPVFVYSESFYARSRTRTASSGIFTRLVFSLLKIIAQDIAAQ